MSEKLNLKKQIIEKSLVQLRELHSELIEEFEMKAHASDSADDGVVAGSFGSDSGMEDMSKETAMVRKEEAEQVKATIKLFENYKFEKEHEEIEPLALVKTNKGYFFITKAVKDVVIDGVKYHMMATDAPIYNCLEGKRRGDKIMFNNMEFECLDVC